jgi:hypothetical protein
MTFLTRVGTNVSGFKISDTPQEFIDTHFELKIFVKVEHKNRGKLYLAVLNIELMKMNRLFAVFTLLITVWSCRNDDESLNPGTLVPPQTLAETAVQNDSEIQAYLQSHFYNYEEFENPPADFDFKVQIDTIAGDNADKLPLLNFIQTMTISVTSEDVGRDSSEGEEVDHILYYIEAIEGEGDQPTFADRTTTFYEGSLLNRTLFDGRTVPIKQYLPASIPGYGKVLQEFNGGTGFVENPNGTVTFSNFSSGLMVIPSGLAYFDSPPPGVVPGTTSLISNYASIVFTFSLLDVEKDTDFDEDGIPSIQEDLNGDGNLNNDNTDDELEPINVFLPNHTDTDDDNDGILTIDEIMINGEIQKDANGLVIFPDTDGDGTPDHLDNDN